VDLQSLILPVGFLNSDFITLLTSPSAFYGQDERARSNLKDEIRDACLNYGFFQLRNHGIPEDLQREILRQSEDFFSLPIETKDKYNKGRCPPQLDLREGLKVLTSGSCRRIRSRLRTTTVPEFRKACKGRSQRRVFPGTRSSS
jgi:isopenicillin N synthase-like dioxygenase